MLAKRMFQVNVVNNKIKVVSPGEDPTEKCGKTAQKNRNYRTRKKQRKPEASGKYVPCGA